MHSQSDEWLSRVQQRTRVISSCHTCTQPIHPSKHHFSNCHHHTLMQPRTKWVSLCLDWLGLLPLLVSEAAFMTNEYHATGIVLLFHDCIVFFFLMIIMKNCAGNKSPVFPPHHDRAICKKQLFGAHKMKNPQYTKETGGGGHVRTKSTILSNCILLR